MSAYCTIEHLSNELDQRTLIELADDSSKPSTINEDLVNGIIATASDLIDGYIRERYALPLSFDSEILRDICMTIVKYKLFGRRRNGSMPDAIQKAYDSAIARLRDIQKGVVTLASTDEAPIATSTTKRRGNYREPAFMLNRF